MGIYQRDNLSSLLAGTLQAALDRHQKTTELQNAYTASNTKAITGLMKSVGRAYEMREEDELKQKLAELQKERNAAATAIADSEAEKSLAIEKRNAEILDAYEAAKAAKAQAEIERPNYSTNEYLDAIRSSERRQYNPYYIPAMRGVY